MKVLRSIFLVSIFVAFVAGITYVGMHRLDNWGFFGDSEVEHQIPEQVYEELEDEDSMFPFIVPMDGREVEGAELSFRFKGEDFTLQAELDHRVYHGAVSAPRGFMIEEDASLAMRHEAIANYYSKLTFDPEMDSAIESVLLQLRSIRDENELDSDQYVELITRFVQAIPYDENRGFVDADAKAMGDPRMPIQVLVDGRADCDEKVMLLAALLAREGFGVSAFYFEPEQHMALGVRSEGEGFHSTGYEFVETTGIGYVSEVPATFVNDIVLESEPVVLKLDPREATGEPVGSGYFSAKATAQIARIVAVRDAAKELEEKAREAVDEARVEFNKLESPTQAEIDAFNSEIERHNACIYAMNHFRATVDNLGRDTGDFVDRVEAIAWIDENAWWE
ncbi:MAG: hypothetical protein FWD93_03045 [Coriobacteriia bacterium]|nr:hypothetical protein [Coriobacteriia bacterium]